MLEYEHTEPSARLERAASSLRGKRSGLVSYEGIVSSVRFERTLPSSSCWCLLPLGYEDSGAAVRCRSGPPALRRRGRSRARRRGFRGWTRTSDGRGQGPAGDPNAPPGTGAGGEIRTLTQPGLSRPGIPVPCHARIVRRQGLEPCLPGLRVQCFTRIARGAPSGMQESDPHSQAWMTGTLNHCVNAAEWFPEGSNLAPADLHSAALPDELENRRLARRIRTSGLMRPKHAPLPLGHGQ
jgi:hypothetical protein